jgi:hypothetical protein
VFVPLETPGHPAVAGDPETNPDYSVRPPGGLPVGLLQSSGPASTSCDTLDWNGTGSSTWGSAVSFSSDPAVQSGWSDTVSPSPPPVSAAAARGRKDRKPDRAKETA